MQTAQENLKSELQSQTVIISLSQKKSNKGNIFVGKPIVARFGPYKDQTLITIATPIIEDGKFKGVLNSGILLSELTKTYLDPLKISENTQIYFLSSDGILLYSTSPGLTGVNIFDFLRDNPFPGSETILKMVEERIGIKEEGKMKIFLPGTTYTKEPPSQYLFAYSPVTFGDKYWFLSISTPVEDISASIGPFYKNQLTTFVFLLVVFIFLTALGLTTLRITYKDGYLKGFNHGKDHRDSKT